MPYEYQENEKYNSISASNGRPIAKELTTDECCDGCAERCQLSVKEDWYGNVNAYINGVLYLCYLWDNKQKNNLKAVLEYSRKTCKHSKLR